MTALALVPEVVFDSIWGRVAIALVVATAVLLAAMRALASDTNAKARIDSYVTGNEASAAPAGRLARLAPLFAATERRFGNLRLWRSTGRMLERAGMRVQTVEFLYLVAALGLGVAVLVGLAGGAGFVSLLLGLAAAAVPFAATLARASRRRRAFDEQLPDLLITLAGALKAGHTFHHGMQAVIEEGKEPAATEFRRVLDEMRLGRPVEQALADMGTRVGSQDFGFVLNAVTIQREIGGSLGTLLELVADTVRERQHFRRKVRGLTGMARLSANVLTVIPVAAALVFSAMRPGYLDPLFEAGIGRVMLVAGICMVVAGGFVLRKMADVKG